MKTKLLAVAALLGALSLGAHAQTPSSSQMEAQAMLEVDNDEMTVSMSVTKEGTQVQALSQSVLATMQMALARAKRANGVDPRLSNVATYPVWGPKGKTANWTVRADLVLVSKDFTSLGLLASELTKELQITNVSFSLSRTKRVQEESRLMGELAETFKEKAKSVTKSFGFKSYEIKTLNFTGQPSFNGPQPMAMTMRASALEQDAVPIPTDGGRSNVSISVVGTFELLK
jgi:predicted secreted protein